MFEISLQDFANKLSQQTGKNIQITQTADKQITAQFLMKIKLDLMGHSDDSLRFRYTLPLGAGVIMQMIKPLKSKKFTLNTDEKTVDLHLSAFGAYRNDLAGKKITHVDLQNGVFVFQTAPLENQ